MPDDHSLAYPVVHDAHRNSEPLVRVQGLNLWYGEKQALRDVAFELYPNEILAFVGPSGCGKTTALRCLNRMNDSTRGIRLTGSITMGGRDIHDPGVDPPMHRKRFGWVAQKPNPFPFSIWENVAYGPRIHGLVASRDMATHVEHCLRRVHLWDEVKDDLHGKSGFDLSGGQQQRLCIARAISTLPEVLLLDEPTGSIDPIATAAIEDLLLDLKVDHSVVIVTHSMAEAHRIADRVACFHLGRLVEIGPTDVMFTAAVTPEARAFLDGQVG